MEYLSIPIVFCYYSTKHKQNCIEACHLDLICSYITPLCIMCKSVLLHRLQEAKYCRTSKCNFLGSKMKSCAFAECKHAAVQEVSMRKGLLIECLTNESWGWTRLLVKPLADVQWRSSANLELFQPLRHFKASTDLLNGYILDFFLFGGSWLKGDYWAIVELYRCPPKVNVHKKYINVFYLHTC